MKTKKSIRLHFGDGFTAQVVPVFRFRMFGTEFAIHERIGASDGPQIIKNGVEAKPTGPKRYGCTHVETGMAVRVRKVYRTPIVALITSWVFIKRQGAKRVASVVRYGEMEAKRLDKKQKRIYRKLRAEGQGRGHGTLRV